MLVARLFGLALWLLGAALPRAETVEDLYAARVPVADQSAAALDTASREALADVVVKVSGSTSVLADPAIVAELAQARRHVQQYAYSRDEDLPGALFARFEFDGDYVTRLITRAGVPLWTANRPEVLVWLVVEGEAGRQFVNWDTSPALAADLLAEFSRRGVPVRLPLYDLADATAITADQAWSLSAAAFLSASDRYNVQDVVAGRLATLSDGTKVGDWIYLSGERRIDRSASAQLEQEFFREGVDLVAQAMAARYAVAPAATDTVGVNMAVSGVYSYADYAAIISWLEKLELIEHANVKWVRGDLVELQLLAQADAGQLAAIIELNRRLVPEPAAAAGELLSYRWQN